MTNPPIRLAVVATAKDNVEALETLRGLAGDRIAHVVHLGGRDADYKANTFFRMRPVRGKRGDLMEGDAFTGAAATLDTGPDLAAAQWEAIDNLTRGSAQMAYKHHGIQDVQDYQHITHIAHDVMAAMLKREGITHVLFFDIPHMFYDTCLRQAAEALGLEVLILRQSFFPTQFFSLRRVPELGHMTTRASDAEARPVDLPEGGPDLFYMKGVKQEREAPGGLTLRAFVQMVAHHARNAPLRLLNPVYMLRLMRRMHKLAGRFPKWRDPFHHFFHTDHMAYFERIAEAEESTPDLSQPYVYFPMQWQPEMTTSSLGGRYRDQLLALERLAAMLPEGHLIYVKENPKQNGKMRSPLFFHRMDRIKQVRLMPSHASSQELLAHSQAVANISGTVGWEGVLAGKPVLCFGATWWAEAPGVTRYSPGLTWEALTANLATRDEAGRFAGQLQARSHRGNVQRQFIRADETLSDAENAQSVAAAVLDLLEGRTPHTFDPIEDRS